jgi:hypothetical protein
MVNGHFSHIGLFQGLSQTGPRRDDWIRLNNYVSMVHQNPLWPDLRQCSDRWYTEKVLCCSLRTLGIFHPDGHLRIQNFTCQHCGLAPLPRFTLSGFRECRG